MTEPLQTVFPTINETGPVTLRQDRSYLHHVVPDPTGQFVLIPDLGGDRIRVYRYDQKKIAPVEELAPLMTAPGVGPRHAAFWWSPSNELYLFFNGELDQNVYSYRINYSETGLSWTKVSQIPAVSADIPATRAPTSEIAVSVSLWIGDVGRGGA